MSSDAVESTGVAVATAETAAPATPETKADTETTPSAAAETVAAGAVPPVVDAGADAGSPPSGRMSKPVIVAAAVAGVVLVALPMALSGLLGDAEPGEGPGSAGYSKDLPPDGGFVPGLAAPPADAAGVPAGQPGNQLPAQAADGIPAGQAGAPADPGTAGLPGGPPPAAGGGPAQAPQQHQGPPPAQQPQGPPAPGIKAVTYEGMAGRGCGSGTGFTGVGAYSDGKSGWVNHGDGGCGTSFVSIPMSGDANKDDTSAYGLWTFNTGPVTVGSCAVSVFVPNGDVTAVGGSPSVYRVYDRFAVDKGTPVGTFQVDQIGTRGRWVNVGTFRINGAKLAVQLLNRGRDWSGSTKTYAHHAAAMVKAKCQA
jgi:translation initiation factor IF-2